VLEIEGLQVRYGAIPAVMGVDLTVAEGEAVALLGRNGAGKTSTLKALAGLLPAAGGRIRLDGKDVTNVPAERRVALGVALAPEGRGVFPQLSVKENLAMGAFHRRLRPRAMQDEVERVTTRFPRLRERIGQSAGSLSGGEQQMLALARSLMSAPRLLLIDEPSLGLAPIIVDQLYELLASLNTEGLTLLIVEQYVEVALGSTDRAYVLDKGRVVLQGTSSELADSPELVDAYLAGGVAAEVAS
jgi:branched-chain amino acid transport system ATP-binding protein